MPKHRNALNGWQVPTIESNRESLTKNLFVNNWKKKKNSSRLCKVRINHLSCSYVILPAACKFFQKNFYMTIQLNCCPLTLQHQASYITWIHVAIFVDVKQLFPELMRFLPSLINSRNHTLPHLMVRKPSGFIQNT